MSLLQEKAREIGLDDLRLLPSRFDPEYDSPGILKQFGEFHDIEFDNFAFYDGKACSRGLNALFGIITMEQDGTINHTMATLLIDQKGRIHYRKAQFVADDFLARAAVAAHAYFC